VTRSKFGFLIGCWLVKTQRTNQSFQKLSELFSNIFAFNIKIKNSLKKNVKSCKLRKNCFFINIIHDKLTLSDNFWIVQFLTYFFKNDNALEKLFNENQIVIEHVNLKLQRLNVKVSKFSFKIEVFHVTHLASFRRSCPNWVKQMCVIVVHCMLIFWSFRLNITDQLLRDKETEIWKMLKVYT
jgi:hypothetical protein